MTAWRASASAESMALRTSPAVVFASASRLCVLGEPALLELGVPQVLGQAVVDLAGEPGPFGHRGVRGIHVAQTPELRVRAAERPVVHAELGDDAHQQDRVEAQSQGVGGRHDPGRDNGVEREMELAECGDDEPRRQETVGDAVADIQAPIQDRGDDEATKIATWTTTMPAKTADRSVTCGPPRVEDLGAGNGWQDRFAAEEHDRGQHDADARRQHEEGAGNGGTSRRRLRAAPMTRRVAAAARVSVQT